MSKNINDEVAKRIKIFIQHLGITTAEFCRKTGLSRQTVDKFKAGIHGPSVESLDKIIKSYPELRLNWLVSGEGMMVERITDDDRNIRNGSNWIPTLRFFHTMKESMLNLEPHYCFISLKDDLSLKS